MISQYKDAEQIVRKYWPILQKDTEASHSELTTIFFFIVKHPVLKGDCQEMLSYLSLKIRLLFDIKGFYPCRKCYMYKSMRNVTGKISGFKSNVMGNEFQIKHFIYVTPLLLLICRSALVGFSMWAVPQENLHIRCEHVQNIKIALKWF